MPCAPDQLGVPRLKGDLLRVVWHIRFGFFRLHATYAAFCVNALSRHK